MNEDNQKKIDENIEESPKTEDKSKISEKKRKNL